MQSQKILQGGSTITQQIARKTFLTDEKTYTRKLREMFIALGIESKYSKDAILEMYLNVAPYGPREGGVMTASQVYFGKKPSDLNDEEMIILALLPKNPVVLSRKANINEWLGRCPKNISPKKCSPFGDNNYYYSRAEILLFDVARALEWNEIKTAKIWNKMKNMHLPGKKSWVKDDFQHFRFFLEDFLASKGYKTSQLNNGITIKTTLNYELQKQMYNYMRDGITERLFVQDDIENFAMITLDNETRGPLVWIGSKYFWNTNISGQVDMLRSYRQAGSTIKPFIYAAAINAGYQPPTIFYDSVVRFLEDGSRLSNSDGHFRGGIRMRQALAQSRNIPAAKALLLAGGR